MNFKFEFFFLAPCFFALVFTVFPCFITQVVRSHVNSETSVHSIVLTLAVKMKHDLVIFQSHQSKSDGDTAEQHSELFSRRIESRVLRILRTINNSQLFDCSSRFQCFFKLHSTLHLGLQLLLEAPPCPLFPPKALLYHSWNKQRNCSIRKSVFD